MTSHDTPLERGLYLLATPIGNAADITVRALDVLARADCIVAEDTRTTRRLMALHNIDRRQRPMFSYHDHSPASARQRILAHLDNRKAVALVSDAGTPLVSDPGYTVVRLAVERGHRIIPLPGASSVLAALTASSLPPDRFLFVGFLPTRRPARLRWLQTLQTVTETVVMFESPRRLTAALKDMIGVLGPDRTVAVCRELTKLHEDIRRGSLAAVHAHYVAVPPRGECVLVVEGARESRAAAGDPESLLVRALHNESLRDAVQTVTAATGLDRRAVYQMALAIRDAQETLSGN